MKTASPKRRRSRRSPPKISAVEKTALRIMRKLYEATGGQPQRWESLGNLGATKADAAGIAYAIERDWLIISGGLHKVSAHASDCPVDRPPFFSPPLRGVER
jgi:hypothetical protein